jgi:NlpC/P60 family putative phage cell wall peptidase
MSVPGPGWRDRVVEEARAWIGTPYLHQASTRGAGTDCLGLVRGVWRAMLGPEPEAPPPYTLDWSEPERDEVLWRAAGRHLRPVAAARALLPGECLVLRMRADGVAKHLGIVGRAAGAPTLIHAYSGRGVVESALSGPWRRRVVARFDFPFHPEEG